MVPICITNNSIKHRSFVYIQLNDQTVLFQTSQFFTSHLLTSNISIRPIDRTQSGVTTPGQSEPVSDCNEGVLHIPPNSSFTRFGFFFWFLCLMAYQPSWVILMPKPSFYLTHSWEDKRVCTFPKGYLSESERNYANGVRTRLLQFCSPPL